MKINFWSKAHIFVKFAYFPQIGTKQLLGRRPRNSIRLLLKGHQLNISSLPVNSLIECANPVILVSDPSYLVKSSLVRFV